MHLISRFLSDEITHAIGWTVLHSFWQGGVIALVLWVLMMKLPASSARLRYYVSLGALFLLLFTSLLTFGWLIGQNSVQEDRLARYFIYLEGISAVDRGAEGNEAALPWYAVAYQYLNARLYFIVSIWLAGMLVFSFRFFLGMGYVVHLRSTSSPILEKRWLNWIRGVTDTWKIRRKIHLAESALIQSPMVIGHIKPLILLPVGAVNGLSPREVEAILAHELAHILRNDYLINIVQSVVEVLYYYHPAVWWISSHIRREREAHCDDMAVSLCGNSLEYAKALVSLQEAQHKSPVFGMSFSGHKNQFLFRIRRILNQTPKKSNLMEKLMASGILLIFIALLSIQAKTSDKNRDMVRQSTEELFHFEAQPDPTLRSVEVTKDTLIPEEPVPPAPPAPPAPPEMEKSVPEPPAPPSPPNPFSFNKKEMSVKMGKDKDGNTVILINQNEEGSPTKLIIQKEDGKVFMTTKEGSTEIKDVIELEKGETISIENGSGQSFFFGQDDDGELFFTAPKIEWNENLFFPENLDFDFEWEETEEINMEDLRREMEALKSEMNEEKMAEVKAMMERARELTERKREMLQRQKERMALQQEQVQREVEMARMRAEEARELARARAEGYREKAEKEAREHAKAHSFYSWNSQSGGTSRMSRAFENAMLEDGLIESRNNYKLELDEKRLKVNNKRQPDKLHQKYIQLYERTTGKEFGDDNKITLEVKSED